MPTTSQDCEALSVNLRFRHGNTQCPAHAPGNVAPFQFAVRLRHRLMSSGSFRERGDCGDRATAPFEDICNSSYRAKSCTASYTKAVRDVAVRRDNHEQSRSASYCFADVTAHTKKKGRLRCHKRPKSREETPKEGSDSASKGTGGRYRMPLSKTIAICGSIARR